MKTITLGLLTLAAPCLAVPAFSQTQTREYSFETQRPPFSAVLTEFAEQTGQRTEYSAGTVTDDTLVGAPSGRDADGGVLAETILPINLILDNEQTFALKRAESNISRQVVGSIAGSAKKHRLAPSFVRVASLEEGGEPEQVTQRRGAAADARRSDNQRQRPRMEEIIVTAQKRNERLQDVPASIAVVTASDLDLRGAVNARDYLRSVPGVNEVDGVNGQTIVIRGLETATYLAGGTTATYFGETPTTGIGGANSDLKLIDIERVEVLRGPQGTAFGSVSMGGAVRTIPVAPNLDLFESKIAAGYSGTAGLGGDNYNVQLIGNVPLLKDRLAIRVVGYTDTASGFYRNRAQSDAAFQSAIVPLGGQDHAVDQDGVGSTFIIGGRVAARFQATDDLSFTFSYLSQKSEVDGFPVATIRGYDQAMFQVAEEHVVRGKREGVSDADAAIANAVMEYNLGWANLLATYSHVDSELTLSQPYQLYGRAWPASFYQGSESSNRVGEIRIVTQLGGPWNFLSGVYYANGDGADLYTYYWFNPDTNFFNRGERFVGDQKNHSELTQKAAFGEVSWEFSPGYTLTGGARAYWYDRTGTTRSPSGFFFAPNTAISYTEFDASGSTFKANLSRELDDHGLLYLGWAQGFRLGNGGGPGLVQCDSNGDGIVDGTAITVASTSRVESDAVDSYELGGKFSLLDRRLTIDAAVFHMIWDDIPVAALAGTVATGCGLTYTANAGAAKSDGIELQTSFQIAEPLRIDLGGSYIRAQLTKDVPVQGFVSGDPLPGSPKINANLGVQYDFTIGSHAASVRADSVYIGSFYDDILETPGLRSGGYVKLDTSARVSVGNLNVDVFVRNVTNQDAFTFRGGFAGAAGTQDSFGYRLRPRTVGFQLSYAFN